MFGYLKLDKDELKLKYIKYYQSIYCGLCKSLRVKYGLLYAIFLNYESVFLYFYLDIIAKKHDKTEIITRCPLNPIMRKRIVINKELMEFVAFINLVLVEFKCRDDINDDSNYFKIILNNIIKRNIGFANDKETYKELLVILEDIIDQFDEKERRHCTIDECMSSMGSFLQCIVSYFIQTNNLENNKSKKVLDIANSIGKWIYTIDAFDDLEMDEKKITLIRY